MELNPVIMVEKLVAIALASFEMQLVLLCFIGHHRERNRAIDFNKKIILDLLKQIEECEISIVCEVEASSEKALAESALGKNIIFEARRQHSDEEIISEMAQIAEAGHSMLLKKLGQSEVEIIAHLSQRFEVMKMGIQELYNRFDKLPRYHC